MDHNTYPAHLLGRLWPFSVLLCPFRGLVVCSVHSNLVLVFTVTWIGLEIRTLLKRRLICRASFVSQNGQPSDITKSRGLVHNSGPKLQPTENPDLPGTHPRQNSLVRTNGPSLEVSQVDIAMDGANVVSWAARWPCPMLCILLASWQRISAQLVLALNGVSLYVLSTLMSLPLEDCSDQS